VEVLHWLLQTQQGRLHAAYALEAKIEEAAVLLKKQEVKAQGIYNAHLDATPWDTKPKWGLFLELGDNSGPRSVILHHQDLWSKYWEKICAVEFQECLYKRLDFFAPWVS